MTQPTDQPTTEQQRRVRRGGRTVLELRKQIRGRVRDATVERVVVEFPGTADLDQQLADLGANIQAHLVFTVASANILRDLSLTVFVDTPDATAETPTDSAGYVQSVAFFEHDGGHHGRPRFRLPLTAALGRLGPRQAALTSTFVPVVFAGRTPPRRPLVVNAALHLVRSTVERD